MRKTEIVYLDCDGTWVDLYGVENWLDDLKNKSARPYEVAKPLVNLSKLTLASLKNTLKTIQKLTKIIYQISSFQQWNLHLKNTLTFNV